MPHYYYLQTFFGSFVFGFFIIIITKNKNNLLRRRFLCKYYIYIFFDKKNIPFYARAILDRFNCVRLVCDENALCYFTLKNLRKSIIIIMFCFTMLLFVEFFVCEKSTTTFFLSCLFVYTLSLPPTSSKNFFKQNDFFLK